MRTIIIQQTDSGYGWHIFEGDKFAYGLTWDEMLGQIASITIPGREKELFGMNSLQDADQALHEKRYKPKEPNSLESFLEAEGFKYDPAGGYNGMKWRNGNTFYTGDEMLMLFTSKLAGARESRNEDDIPI